MGLEHFNVKPVQQGKEKMGCWAASMSWWSQSVRKYTQYTMAKVAELYKNLADPPPPGCTIGGLGDFGVRDMFADNRWHLWQTWQKRSEVTMTFLNTYLSAGPTFIAYYDPKLGGAHMNVIVDTVPFTDSHLFIMDPDYASFQIRPLRYYTEKSQKLVIASSKTF